MDYRGQVEGLPVILPFSLSRCMVIAALLMLLAFQKIEYCLLR
jgi:hypothetical protein